MKINFSSKTIEVTKTFANKASRFGSEEYTMLLTASRDLPDFTVVVKATKPVRRSYTKSPTYGLTYESMGAYISMNDEDGSLMRDFQILRQGCSYGEIKKWFMTKFPEFNNFAA